MKICWPRNEVRCGEKFGVSRRSKFFRISFLICLFSILLSPVFAEFGWINAETSHEAFEKYKANPEKSFSDLVKFLRVDDESDLIILSKRLELAFELIKSAEKPELKLQLIELFRTSHNTDLYSALKLHATDPVRDSDRQDRDWSIKTTGSVSALLKILCEDVNALDETFSYQARARVVNLSSTIRFQIRKEDSLILPPEIFDSVLVSINKLTGNKNGYLFIPSVLLQVGKKVDRTKSDKLFREYISKVPPRSTHMAYTLTWSKYASTAEDRLEFKDSYLQLFKAWIRRDVDRDVTANNLSAFKFFKSDLEKVLLEHIAEEDNLKKASRSVHYYRDLTQKSFPHFSLLAPKEDRIKLLLKK